MNRVAIILDNYDRAKSLIELEVEDVLFELRMDKDPRLITLLEEGQVDRQRCIITYRSKEEGGDGEAPRDQLLNKFAKYNCQYLDVEIKRDSIPRTSSTIVYSTHDYTESMEIAAKEFSKSYSTVDGVYKFVGKPYDTLDLLNAYDHLSKIYPRHVILGIGRNAEISRTLLPQEFVFGSLSGGEMIEYKELLNLNDDSVMLGLIGKELEYSLSPIIHKFLLQESRQTGYYHLLEASDPTRMEVIFHRLEQLGFLGLNVTQPYKNILMNLVDYLDESVILTNSINTIKFGTKTQATNTDTTGFSRFLCNHQLQDYESAIIIGAGGAARSVAVSLLDYGFEVEMMNRSENRFVESPVELRSQVHLQNLSKKLEADIIINATTSSISGNLPYPEGTEISCGVAIDLYYRKSKFLETINAQSTFNGLEMLFYQAVHSFNFWMNTNLDPPYSQEVFL